MKNKRVQQYAYGIELALDWKNTTMREAEEGGEGRDMNDKWISVVLL